MGKKRLATSILTSAAMAFTLFSSVHVQATEQLSSQAIQGSYEKGELNIQFHRLLTKTEREVIYQKYGLTEKSTLQNGLFANVTIEDYHQLKAVAQALVQETEIASAEPNYHMASEYKPNDSYYGRQWFHSKINAPHAWNRTRGSSQLTVAVIDGGVDMGHPEFKGRLVKPYNAVTNSTTFPPDDHGTHVAGIIGAAMDGAGTTGVAPGVKIMPINVFEGEYAESYDVSRAIMYAADQGADVLNLSFGTYDYSSIVEYAVNYAYKKGAVVVAAAGNESTSKPLYPASHSNAISVSATNSKDKIAYFSNYGRYIDVSAPGEDILSTVIDDSYAYMDGTSMAAPVVSGEAALILSKNPFLTPSQVKKMIYSSTRDLGKKGWDSYYGIGRIDTYQALKMTKEPMGTIVLSSKEYTGQKNVRAGVAVYGNMRGTVYVEDAAGNNVNTLISSQPPQKGGFAVYWNGKLQDGSYAPPGEYKIVFRVSDNRQSMMKKAAVTVVQN
ncbi:S8 family serine peptidase [Bacillus sp. FJAT-42315]|uniref:S8 family serine peptidase n=1 Tax=Bacillus sp. FJAT-42315 TaxID=2014077 RepID=UPI000C2329CD|nr:S8 family serine peptidase [Bacillus sp. FJAT-42315]